MRLICSNLDPQQVPASNLSFDIIEEHAACLYCFNLEDSHLDTIKELRSLVESMPSTIIDDAAENAVFSFSIHIYSLAEAQGKAEEILKEWESKPGRPSLSIAYLPFLRGNLLRCYQEHRKTLLDVCRRERGIHALKGPTEPCSLSERDCENALFPSIEHYVWKTLDLLSFDAFGIAYFNPSDNRYTVIGEARKGQAGILLSGEKELRLDPNFNDFIALAKDTPIWAVSKKGYLPENLRRSLDCFASESVCIMVIRTEEKILGAAYLLASESVSIQRIQYEVLLSEASTIAGILLEHANKEEAKLRKSILHFVEKRFGVDFYQVDEQSHDLLDTVKSFPVQTKKGPCFVHVFGHDEPCSQCPIDTGETMSAKASVFGLEERHFEVVHPGQAPLIMVSSAKPHESKAVNNSIEQHLEHELTHGGVGALFNVHLYSEVDQSSVALTALVKTALRPLQLDRLVYPYGPSAYMILVPDAKEEDLPVLAERIYQALHIPFQRGEEALNWSIAGHAYPKEIDSLFALGQNAKEDEKAFQRYGAGRYITASGAPLLSYSSRLEEAKKNIQETNSVTMSIDPIVEIKTGRIAYLKFKFDVRKYALVRSDLISMAKDLLEGEENRIIQDLYIYEFAGFLRQNLERLLRLGIAGLRFIVPSGMQVHRAWVDEISTIVQAQKCPDGFIHIEFAKGQMLPPFCQSKLQRRGITYSVGGTRAQGLFFLKQNAITAALRSSLALSALMDETKQRGGDTMVASIHNRKERECADALSIRYGTGSHYGGSIPLPELFKKLKKNDGRNDA